MFYINKKGNKVNLTIKRHAIIVFCERFQRLFNKSITGEEAELYIKHYFRFTHKVNNLNYKEVKRIKRHGPTFYFRDSNFTYGVCDVFVITVEISRKGFRYLN